MAKPGNPLQFTKADTVALWHAVSALDYQVRAMSDMARADGSKFTVEEINAERERLLAAKRALRKANAIRKAGVDPRQRSLL